LCLEALDERILPSAGPFTHMGYTQYDVADDRAQEAALLSALYPALPKPDLMGAKGSKVDLGRGTLTINTEFYDWKTGSMRFTGTFVSSDKILLGPPGASLEVSDSIGAIPVTGRINFLPVFSPWSHSAVGGIPVDYFTTGISFQGVGDGSVGSLHLPEHQQFSFSGSVLTWRALNGPLQYSIGGTIGITDTVQNVPLSGTQTVPISDTVPGITFAGMNWSPIQFL
jgi:hypothetical protein